MPHNLLLKFIKSIRYIILIIIRVVLSCTYILYNIEYNVNFKYVFCFSFEQSQKSLKYREAKGMPPRVQ